MTNFSVKIGCFFKSDQISSYVMHSKSTEKITIRKKNRKKVIEQKIM